MEKFEPWWTLPLSEFLLGKLEDRDLSIENLSFLSRVSLNDINTFINNERNLTDSQFISIEETLGLPPNYFNRLKELYIERIKTIC